MSMMRAKCHNPIRLHFAVSPNVECVSSSVGIVDAPVRFSHIWEKRSRDRVVFFLSLVHIPVERQGQVMTAWIPSKRLDSRDPWTPVKNNSLPFQMTKVKVDFAHIYRLDKRKEKQVT